MRKKIAFLLLSLLFLFLSITKWGLSQEGRGRGRVFGTVVDQNGNPIEGASIEVESLEYNFKLQTKSTSKGTWAVIGVGNGVFRIRASKEGYIPAETQTRLSNFQNPQIDLILKSIEATGIQALQEGETSKKIYTDATNLYEAGKYKAALQLFQSFREKNPTLFQVGINIGNCYRELGEYEQALQEYQVVFSKLKEKNTSLEGNENAARVLTNIGETYLKMGQLDKATNYFEQAITIFPKDYALAYNIAEIYFNQNQFDKAIKMYDLSIQINPSWPKAYLKKGYALLNKGDYRASIKALKKFLELDPKAPEASAVKTLISELEKRIKE